MCLFVVVFFQWIQCDMRYFDMTVLGKFSVVMADPPWDIHMEVHTELFYYVTHSPTTSRNKVL